MNIQTCKIFDVWFQNYFKNFNNSQSFSWQEAFDSYSSYASNNNMERIKKSHFSCVLSLACFYAGFRLDSLKKGPQLWFIVTKVTNSMEEIVIE